MQLALFSGFVADFSAAKCVFGRFFSLSGDVLSRIFKNFKNKYPKHQYLLMTRRMCIRCMVGPRASDKGLEKGHPGPRPQRVGQVTRSQKTAKHGDRMVGEA